MVGWSWVEDALCKDSGVDFFSENLADISKAQTICEDCPVRRECLETALKGENRFGVWGGASPFAIRTALGVDIAGKPKNIAPMCPDPECASTVVDVVARARTFATYRCPECSLEWRGRIPTVLIKIDAEGFEDASDDNDDN